MRRTERIEESIVDLARRYPPPLRAAQERDTRRIAFHVRLVLDSLAGNGKSLRECSVMDVGGGIGMLSLACRAAGIGRVILVDDFADPVNEEVGDEVLALHKSAGVEVAKRDVLRDGLAGLGSGFDAITFFDTIEHWHHSPKAVLHEAVRLLKPGGWIVIGVPNSVNLRKRLTVPLGYGKWTQMKDWYERSRFRGHVREPDVEDLRYIAKDLRLKKVRILGRNWAGYFSASRLVRWSTWIADPLLRLRPSLCSDLYLMGSKD
ncbi:MAG: hypothetical protein KatS3mg082_2640 [Nitrospiraceae bacterium]|nr:MAG: hypothetical protein KatS3mg082_2640 [Nitrospiraceae bacterium]